VDWSALLSTFGLIFVAELGDKTQLAVVTQTCKYRQPWAVFLGASLALTAVTGLGAAGGQLLGRFVPEPVLRLVAAAAFGVMGLLIGCEAYRAGRQGYGETCEVEAETTCAAARRWDWRVFAATFGLLFVAEMGDKTQLAVLGLAGERGTPLAVFLGGALALIAVTAVGVVGGQGLTRLIPQRVLLWMSALAFVLMGVLMGFGVL